jgi:SAM-dependent methyltransferase
MTDGAGIDGTVRAGILERVERYYTSALERHGPTARGADWNSPESQALRFQQLLRLLPEPSGASAGLPSFNDYGCGYGALLDHLRAAGLGGVYRGFDVSASMVEQARALHAGVAGAEFTDDEAALSPADFTVASGIFNVKQDVDEATWRAYVLDTLARMRALSRRGFAFNCLTAHADPDRKRPDLFYADPLDLFEHCRRSFSRRVALLHDYPLYEFTVLVRLDEER